MNDAKQLLETVRRESRRILELREVSFGRADAFDLLGRIAKPRCMSFAFFAVKENVPKPPLAQTRDFFAAMLLDNLGKIPHTEWSAARYQLMGRIVSTFFNEWNTHAR